jgi:hypothetical protein
MRSPFVARLLKRLGIDARRYWLLLDLFEELTDRRDLYSQFGASGAGLKFAALMYLFFFGLMGVVFALGHPPAITFLAVFLGLTAMLILVTLLPETGNSLVNPSEGMLLAHQPIDGATYTAAKLTHLLRIVVYLVPAINLVPALMGWNTRGSYPAYPLVHMAAALLVGVAMGLTSCALYGWLTLLVPARRLKSAGQWLDLAPWLIFVVFQFNREWLKRAPAAWAALDPRLKTSIAAIGAAVTVALMLIGLRALSSDYLVKVASIAQGRARRAAPARRARSWKTAWLRDPAVRAGFDYAAIMIRRDHQFRRQAFTVLAPLLINAAALFQGLSANPFEGKFSALHVFPHALGIASLVLASVIAGGSHPQASWIFLLVPERNLGPFSSGLAQSLAWMIAGIPNILILALLAWTWGPSDALLFAAFSTAVSLAYFAASLHLIEGLPFSKQPDPARQSTLLPIMIVAGLVTALVVAFQHFLLFHSRALVMAAAAIITAGAVVARRYSLNALEGAIRFHLSTLALETSSLYREVG